MFDRDPLTTVVCVSKSDQLGATMNKLRAWLDGQKIYLASFRTDADARGYTFTIGFRDAHDADLFRAQFGA